MPSLFTVTSASSTVRLDEDRQGETAFTAFNASGRTVAGRAVVVADAPASNEWFTVLGESEREFAVAAAEQYRVQIRVSPVVQAGDYAFRLDMVGVENPDEDYTQGPTVILTVPEASPERKPFPWWIVAAAVGGIILIAIVVAVVLATAKATVPNVVGQSLGDAEQTVEANRLSVGANLEGPGEGITPGHISATTPEAGERLRRGSSVDLVIAVAPTETSTPTPTQTGTPTQTKAPAPTRTPTPSERLIRVESSAKISVLVCSSGDSEGATRASRTFSRAYPDAKVNLQVQTSVDWARLAAMIAAGAEPDVICCLDEDSATRLVRMGALNKLGPYLDAANAKRKTLVISRNVYGIWKPWGKPWAIGVTSGTKYPSASAAFAIMATRD